MSGNLLIGLTHDNSGEYVYLAGPVDPYTLDGVTVLSEGTDLGTPTETPQYSRTLDSLGVTVTGATKEAREQSIAMLVEADTVSDLQTTIDSICDIVDKIGKRGGGTLHYRSVSGDKVTRFRIAHAKISSLGSISDYETFGHVRITISLVVDRLGLAPKLDVIDSFTTDTFTDEGLINVGGPDYTAVWGALSNVTIGPGSMTFATNLSTENVFTHVSNYSDVELQSTIVTGASVVGYKCGHAHRVIDTNNMLLVYLDAATNRLRITKIVGGAFTELAYVAVSVAADTSYKIITRQEANTITAEIYRVFDDVAPTPLGTPYATVSHTLSISDTGYFGTPASSRPCGIYVRPVSATARIDDFAIRPFTYKAVSFPRTLRLNGEIGGTSDALAAVTLTASPTAYSETTPYAMMLAWWPKPEPFNMCLNHSGEADPGLTAYGWSASAVTGVMTNAGSSLTRAVEAGAINAYGKEFIQVVTNAAGSSGAAFPIYTRGGFKKGVTYTATCQVKATASANQARIGLGKNGDMQHGTASALNTVWTGRTVTWTPTADTDIAYVTVQVTTASATTLQFRQVQVYEGATAPRTMLGGYGPGVIPALGCDPANTGGFTAAADANYLLGSEMGDTGQLSNVLSFFLLPHLFVPDNYTNDEVDIAVFARCEVQSTQASLNCRLQVVPDAGYGAASYKYSEFYADGKMLTLPSGTRFKPYYLGTVTVKVDKKNPRRIRLQAYFTSSVAATGFFGVDYLVAVPAKNVASTMTGALRAAVSPFFLSTVESTRLVKHDLSVYGGYESNPHNTDFLEPDQSLCLNPILFDNGDENELFVWPSSQVIDEADASSTNSMTIGATMTAQVSVQPQVHLLNQ